MYIQDNLPIFKISTSVAKIIVAGNSISDKLR